MGYVPYQVLYTIAKIPNVLYRVISTYRGKLLTDRL